MKSACKTETTPSRRALLQGATAAAILAPAATIGAAAIASVPDPLIALGVEWRQARERCAATYATYSNIHSTLPDWCSGWPNIRRAPTSLGIPRYVGVDGFLTLDSVRKFNRHTEGIVAGSPDLRDEYAKRRAQGRARVRWWCDERRRQLEIEESSGLDAANKAVDMAQDARGAIEDQIRDAVPTTIRGALVKLELAASWFRDDVDNEAEHGFAELLVINAVSEIGRLTGGMA